MRRVTLCALVIGALTMASAHAAENYPKIIQSIIGSGAKVEKRFPAASGLTGWVISQGGQSTLVFTTPDNKTLISGVLLDENANNLTAVYADKYVSKPDLSDAYKQLEKSTYIVEGPAQPKAMIYVFFDPNCPYCHLAWKQLQAYEKVGLQVRWVPVAYLADSSLGKAIHMLAAKDKTAAFRAQEESFRHGSPAPAGYTEKAYPVQAKALEGNEEVMHRFGMNGTPAFVWKDKEGRVRSLTGLPPTSQMASMSGLPEQPPVDPRLK